jgi:hypothetical protein
LEKAEENAKKIWGFKKNAYLCSRFENKRCSLTAGGCAGLPSGCFSRRAERFSGAEKKPKKRFGSSKKTLTFAAALKNKRSSLKARAAHRLRSWAFPGFFGAFRKAKKVQKKIWRLQKKRLHLQPLSERRMRIEGKERESGRQDSSLKIL